jgi:hypothetical protein
LQFSREQKNNMTTFTSVAIVPKRITVAPAHPSYPEPEFLQAKGHLSLFGRKVLNLLPSCLTSCLGCDEITTYEIVEKLGVDLRKIIFSYYLDPTQIEAMIMQRHDGLLQNYPGNFIQTFVQIREFVCELNLQYAGLSRTQNANFYTYRPCTKIENLTYCFPNLTKLNLGSVGIVAQRNVKGIACADQCLHSLSKLSHLEHLNLSGNGLTLSSLEQLSSLTKLKTLVIEDCNDISDDDIDALETQIAGLQVNRVDEDDLVAPVTIDSTTRDPMSLSELEPASSWVA